MPTESPNHGDKPPLVRAGRAVVYVRVASSHGGSAQALDAQRVHCQEIAARYSLAVAREYVDSGCPARLERQPELRRLLADLAQRQDVESVVISDYARLARDLTQLDTIIRQVRSYGAEITTMTGVETAERFIRTRELHGQVAEWASGAQPLAPYPVALLRAAHQGLAVQQTLSVTVTLPTGETVRGEVTGIGSRLGVSTPDGHLLEDVSADWVVSAEVRRVSHESR